MSKGNENKGTEVENQQDAPAADSDAGTSYAEIDSVAAEFLQDHGVEPDSEDEPSPTDDSSEEERADTEPDAAPKEEPVEEVKTEKEEQSTQSSKADYLQRLAEKELDRRAADENKKLRQELRELQERLEQRNSNPEPKSEQKLSMAERMRAQEERERIAQEAGFESAMAMARFIANQELGEDAPPEHRTEDTFHQMLVKQRKLEERLERYENTEKQRREQEAREATVNAAKEKIKRQVLDGSNNPISKALVETRPDAFMKDAIDVAMEIANTIHRDPTAAEVVSLLEERYAGYAANRVKELEQEIALWRPHAGIKGESKETKQDNGKESSAKRPSMSNRSMAGTSERLPGRPSPEPEELDPDVIMAKAVADWERELS